jgi:hypothetical protein
VNTIFKKQPGKKPDCRAITRTVAFFGFVAFSDSLSLASASAGEAKLWKASGNWNIYLDTDSAKGCFAERVLDDATTVRFGTVPDRNGGFFAAYNSSWADIEVGSTAVIEFDFGAARFAGEAMGVELNNAKGGYVFFDNPAFVQEFGKRYSVKVKVRGEFFAEYDLVGTSNSIADVLACQAQQNDAQPEE